MDDQIKVVEDPEMSAGHCLVVDDGEAVYYGKIGIPLIPHLKPGVLLVLHPVDYADGEKYQKMWERPN